MKNQNCKYCGCKFDPIEEDISADLRECLEAVESCASCCYVRLEDSKVVNDMLESLKDNSLRYRELGDCAKSILDIAFQDGMVEYWNQWGPDGDEWWTSKNGFSNSTIYRVKRSYTLCI
jgi:hypothetical protein